MAESGEELVINTSWTAGYCEIQLHGEKSHGIENIQMVLFEKRTAEKNPDLLDMLKEKNIPYSII